MSDTVTAEQLRAKVILDYITKHPEKHEQKDWFTGDYENDCGTTACVAGYAILFSNDSRFTYQRRWGGYTSAMTDNWVTIKPIDANVCDFHHAGRELLGLSKFDASVLFFNTTNDQARAALEVLVQGDRIDWPSIIEDFDPGHIYNEYDFGYNFTDADLTS